MRAVPAPAHELVYRVKQLSRFLGNERGDQITVKAACLPAIAATLGTPRWLGLLIDWTSFDVTLPKLTGGGTTSLVALAWLDHAHDFLPGALPAPQAA